MSNKDIIEELKKEIEYLYDLEESILSERCDFERAYEIQKKRFELEEKVWELENKSNDVELADNTLDNKKDIAILYSVPVSYEGESIVDLSSKLIEELTLDEILDLASKGVLKEKSRL